MTPRLTAEQIYAIEAARGRMKKIRRAVAVARFDAYSLAFFAVVTLLFGYSSPSAIFVGLGLGAVAFVELRATPMLLQLEPRAAVILGWNQVALMAVLILYSLWNLLVPPVAPPMDADTKEALKSVGMDITDMVSQANHLFYTVLIALSVAFQGYSAIFHFRRKKLIEEYLIETPDWISHMQRTGIGI